MNNGVENNQNVPTMTPIANGVPSTSVPVDTTSAVATTETPTFVVPSVVDTASQTPVMQGVNDANPVSDGTLSVTSPVDASSTVLPNTELPSISIEEEDDGKKKKKKKEKKNKKEKEATEEVQEDVAPKEKKSIIPVILLFVIFLLGAYIYYLNTSNQRTLAELNYKCTPVNESKEEINLDVNSTLVQDLYSKVYTSIREDVAQPEWNDTMRLYLAFRQISEHEMYDSNCNMFSAGRMEPYTCEVSVNFIPKAFRTSTLALEWKKLYGENTPMPLINVKLENSCIGGYEYIPERDEYVQGYCKQPTATSFRATKTLKEALSSRNTIILVEEVKYAGNEKMELPSYLKSGTYYYTFRLDMNYNYVLISKKLDEKY